MNEHEIESMRNVFNNLRKKIEPLSESPKILNLRERDTKRRLQRSCWMRIGCHAYFPIA